MRKIQLNEKEVCDLYIKGESTLTLSKRYGISYTPISRILKRNGIKIRNNKEKSLNAVKQGRNSNSKLQRKITRENWLGKNNPRWKPNGSKRKSHDYILIKVSEHKWQKEERFIAEKLLKRKLKGNEVIHHINSNKMDNRTENLYLMTRTEHKAWHTLDNLNRDLADNRPVLKSNLI
jgi:hypothetical protein